ncbi:6372_t:CDS:1, partial [Acaulospora morrowiae]
MYLIVKRSSKTANPKKRQQLTMQTSNKKPCKLPKVDLTNTEKENTHELPMTLMEKLEYEERMLIIAERKEKLRELRIANTIKEREL